MAIMSSSNDNAGVKHQTHDSACNPVVAKISPHEQYSNVTHAEILLVLIRKFDRTEHERYEVKWKY